MNISSVESRSNQTDFGQHLKPLVIDGLRGRLWRANALNKKHGNHLIVIIYGHHASLERNQGLLQYLRHFGEVLALDLPGLGGMDSFYKINKKPTLDNYAIYLNNVLKKQLTPDKNFTLMGFSLGFLIASQFLKKYPQQSPRVNLLISLVGFLSGQRLIFSPIRRKLYLLGATLISQRFIAGGFRYVILNRFVLRYFYATTKLAKSKFKNLTKAQKRQLLVMETHLWHCNDVRTWAYTAKFMLTANLLDYQINGHLYHIATQGDQFLDNQANLMDLKKVYKRVDYASVNLPSHAPTVIATEKEASLLMPASLILHFKNFRD
ncbi:MAG: alpha/beta hydrolase [Candidatus Saccharibacteria bacterium]|nr:alpha/beta hydrolase [Candidatus Saccharibacteria bacterium]